MKNENDLESGLLKQKSIKLKRIKKEQDKEQEENNENKKCINCSCVIGSAFTTVICTCVLWLIIQYK
jgi:hypothetical protein